MFIWVIIVPLCQTSCPLSTVHYKRNVESVISFKAADLARLLISDEAIRTYTIPNHVHLGSHLAYFLLSMTVINFHQNFKSIPFDVIFYIYP